jgi:hypothetical protein
MVGDGEYDSTAESLDRYFLSFAIAVRSEVSVTVSRSEQNGG